MAQDDKVKKWITKDYKGVAHDARAVETLLSLTLNINDVPTEAPQPS